MALLQVPEGQPCGVLLPCEQKWPRMQTLQAVEFSLGSYIPAGHLAITQQSHSNHIVITSQSHSNHIGIT